MLDTPITEEDEPQDSSSHDTSPDPPPSQETTPPGSGRDDQRKVVRRKNLPAPISDMADFSLWSLLRKNIGEGKSPSSPAIEPQTPTYNVLWPKVFTILRSLAL